MDFKTMIKSMTLMEKVFLLSGKNNWETQELPRHGVPSIFLADGPSGLRKQAGPADHLGLNPSLAATCYPSAATVANAWDTSLAKALAAHVGKEARAQQISVLLGPGLNIKRSPTCGRNFEYFSEDPYLSGKMAAAYVQGIQSQGVAACPKHYAANSQELNRMNSDSILDERTLREIYLTAFEIAVQEGQPFSIMTAYNKLNGTYTNEHPFLMRKVLKEEWGFNGFCVTDWGGSNSRVDGLKAGNHLEMPGSSGISNLEVLSAIEDGTLSETLLDERLEEFLPVLCNIAPDENPADFDEEAHHQFARKAAAESIVLLKNDDAILPLDKDNTVAVLGDFAQTPRYQGAGSSLVNPTRLDKPLDFLKASGLTIAGYGQGYLRGGGADKALLQQAVKLAQKADTVLLYMGLDESLESEGQDRRHLRIQQNQVDLLNAVYAVNTNIVVVLAGGAPFETPWYAHCKAIIHGYLGGQAGAGAMVDALLGDINPGGKLAESWPLSYQDTPAYNYYPGKEKTAEYRESIFVGYRYYDSANVAVRFPFGFGLSYTTFEYSDLKASHSEVTLTVTNTGATAGSEVVQLYIAKPKSDIFRADKELKAFAKVSLASGESKTVALPLDDKAFRYYNIKTGAFEIEAGEYIVMAGASSVDIRLQTTLQHSGSGAPSPYDEKMLPAYYQAIVKQVPNDQYAALIKRDIPAARWDKTLPLTLNDSFAQLFYAKGWVGRFTYFVLNKLKRRSEKKNQPDLNLLFIFNLPFRGVAKMTGGLVDIAMAEGLLKIFNGHFFKGVGHLFSAWRKKNKRLKAAKEVFEKDATLPAATAPDKGDNQ